MTQEAFIKELEERVISYELQGEKCIVTHMGYVYLFSLQSLPAGVVFQNGGHVWLFSLQSLPPGVVFQNEGDVDLDSLQTLPTDVVFQNGGGVLLDSLIGGWFEDWSGNIKGVRHTDLLNHLIKKGTFI
jgi:hypothetical protein